MHDGEKKYATFIFNIFKLFFPVVITVQSLRLITRLPPLRSLPKDIGQGRIGAHVFLRDENFCNASLFLAPPRQLSLQLIFIFTLY